MIIAELLIRARGIAHILGGKVELTDEGDYIEPTNEQKLETERYLLEQIAEYRQKCDFEKAADFEGYLQKFRKREYRKVENVAEAFGEITAAFGALEKEFERLGWMKTHTLINLGLGGFLFHGKNKHFAIK